MKGNRFAWLFLLFLAAASACGFIFYYEPEVLPIDRTALHQEWLAACPGTTLRSGDLVFRHSRGTISNMLLHFSRQDPKYSHAGILSVERTGLFVYHSLGGEVSRAPGIRRERLEQFCSPAAVHTFGIYRLDLDSLQAFGLVRTARMLYDRHMPFDTRYDLLSDSALYCTEFIYKALKQVEGAENYVNLTTIPGFTYVACDNLYLHDHARLVYEYCYAE